MDTEQIADQILKKLNEAGHIAYFAGGWVRDLCMGHPSSDIDIATSAPPEKIRELFPKTIPVGVNFGVVVVLYKGHQFEVSTFRKDYGYVDGRHPTHVEFSTAKEDAMRRDFTINGMFYDPMNEEILDFVEGQKDIQQKIIRTIGEPKARFGEDRLRMIRAVRFAARFGFAIAESTERAMIEYAETLFPAVSMERIWQEFKKMAEGPRFDRAVLEMKKLGLLEVIFPKLAFVKEEELQKRAASFAYFPKKCPAILYILELFQGASFQEMEEICRYLKATNHDVSLAEMFFHVKGLVEGKADDADWARFYSNKGSDVCLKAFLASLPGEQREKRLEEHEARKRRLDAHIKRIRVRQPLVSAKDLMKEGIAPGKKMGELLKEAEKIAIENDLEKSEQVMEMLKKSEKWPC
jgi:poly(A) polymerase